MRIGALVAAGFVVCGLGTSAHPSSLEAGPPRCSLIPIHGSRDPATTYVVAVALRDTVLAGPGAVAASNLGGHWGRGSQRPVYGQLLRIDSLGGAELATVRTALGGREPRIVAVPWDYDPACEPTYWSRSAQWAAPDLAGFYRLQLRPRALWAGDRPTFDAFTADLQPYPHGVFFQSGYRGTDALRERPSIDAREMFSLYAALPTRGLTSDSTSLEPLRRWAAEHPELVTRYPADNIVRVLLRR